MTMASSIISLFPIGLILHDTYRIERLIGRGGNASVFEVSHVRLPKRFALKVMTEPTAQSDDFLLRFRREAEILASLEHPNLVSVLDWNTTQFGQPYLVMELLSGEDVSSLIVRCGALPTHVALSIFAQAASALEIAHACGIIHRDLKPSNLFLCRNGLVPYLTKVFDFGIAKCVQHNAAVVTENLAVMGTPAYMAPEQARGDIAAITHLSDQFSLALVLYEMLSGKSAFHRPGESPVQTLCRVLMDDPEPLAEPAMNAVIMRALQKKPELRYPTLSAFVDAVIEASSVPREQIALPEVTDKIATDSARSLVNAAGVPPSATRPGLVEGSLQFPVFDGSPALEITRRTPAEALPPGSSPQSIFDGVSIGVSTTKRPTRRQVALLGFLLPIILVWVIIRHYVEPIEALSTGDLSNYPAAVHDADIDDSGKLDLESDTISDMTDVLDMMTPLDQARPAPPPKRGRILISVDLPVEGRFLIQRCVRSYCRDAELRPYLRQGFWFGRGADGALHIMGLELAAEKIAQIDQCATSLRFLLKEIPKRVAVKIQEEKKP